MIDKPEFKEQHTEANQEYFEDFMNDCIDFDFEEAIEVKLFNLSCKFTNLGANNYVFFMFQAEKKESLKPTEDISLKKESPKTMIDFETTEWPIER